MLQTLLAIIPSNFMCDAIATALWYIYPADHVLYLTVELQQQVDEIALNRNKEITILLS